MRSMTRLVVLLSCVMVSGMSFAADRYVNIANPSPASPFNSWANAATNIQAVIDDAATVPGDVIWVTNGTYRTGGKMLADGLTNRVCIDKAVTVKSVNGPAVTVIEGAQGVGGLYNTGTGAVRCVYLTNGALLSGFAITNGHTLSVSAEAGKGGGVYSLNGIITNCVIVGNGAYWLGGGVHGGSVFNSRIASNRASNGGGVYETVIQECEVSYNNASEGGGLRSSVARRCIIRNNSSGSNGGGGYASELFNCLVYGNSAYNGGGLSIGSVDSCTFVSNTAMNVCGGISAVTTATNTISYFNTSAVSNNWFDIADMQSCCTTPMPVTGANNIIAAPTFVDAAAGNYRLARGSSCLNIGTNLAWMTSGVDLDGNPRIQRGVVDIGAYEMKSAGLPFLPVILSESN